MACRSDAGDAECGDRKPCSRLREPACSVAAKATLRAASGALAIDMESAAVAEAAAEAGVPFLVLRVIADPADRAIPPVALHGVAPDGSRRPWAVLRG